MARPNILDRFRPVGAPGPAGQVGVPAAADQGPAAELAPVFAALAADVESCRTLVEQARQEADGALFHAREQVASLIAQARLDEAGERTRAAADVERAASERDSQLLAQARTEAGDLEDAGIALLPGTVRKVIDRLWSEHLMSEHLTQPP
jgi:hypothetical protein